MSGSYECHGHIMLGNGTLEEKFTRLSENGVGYFRDAGINEEKLFSDYASRVKDLAARFNVEFAMPVFAFYKEGRYGKFLGKSFTDTKDFYKGVVRAKTLGADFIKVMYSGIASFKNPGTLTYESLNKEEIKEIVNIVHGEGLCVMAHCNGADTIKYAIEYGTDSIEHGIFIDDEGIKMLSYSAKDADGTVWVPTICAVTNELLQSEHKKSVEKAALIGASIACGSDSGCSSVDHGTGTESENDMLVSCGLSESDIESGCKRIRQRFKKEQ